MEHLNFSITEMEHLNFLAFRETTRTAEQVLGLKIQIMYDFILWNTSVDIPNDAPVQCGKMLCLNKFDTIIS